MKTRLTILTALLLAGSAPAAFAQGNQPIISVNMTEVDVISSFSPLTYYAIYGANPYFGTGGVAAVNGGNGPFTDTIEMWALATGTFPEGGYNYTFYVNGQQIGTAILTPSGGSSDGIPQSIGWTPPQPGVYYLSCNATDGLGHAATSLAAEYFATGVSIVSPQTNSFIPLGSSVVIQAVAAVAPGAISRVDFWVDGGPHSGGTFLGSAVNYPYSVIYTPDAPLGYGQEHWVNVHAYLANGAEAFPGMVPVTSVIVVQPVTPIPVCVISSPSGTPAAPSTVPIPDYGSSASAFIPIVVNASGALNITHVELYINGVLFNTIATFPYSFQWQPTVTGIYNLTALAYDGKNNVIASTTSSSPTLTPAPTTVIIGALPTVAITSPGNGSTLNGGGTAVMTATATDTNRDALGNPISITQVQFFQDGNFVGVATQPTSPGGNSYTVTFTAKQNIDPATGLPIPSLLTAIATDALGFTGNSPTVEVSVTSGGSGGGTIIGIPPTVSIVNPTSQENVVVNTPVTLSATGTAPNGNIQQIEFLVDNNVLSTTAKYPYSVIWTPQNLGTYTITAQVTDNVGDKENSTAVTVVVVPEPPPTVSIAAPSAGGIVIAGSGTSVTANAASPSGTIAQVQFYANGLSIGTATALPYTVSWTPLSTGVYTLTAIATDNSGETTTSAASIVEAVANTGGLGNSVYFGQYQGLTDGGRFAFATIDGKYGAFIGHSSAPYTASSVLYTDLSVGSGGGFANTSISGGASATGVTGTLLPSKDQFIGTITQSGSVPVAAGYYTGSLSGQAASEATAIVGYNGEIMVYVSLGSFADAGDSTVDSSGAFSIVTPLNNTIAGKVDPATGFLSATLTGGPGGLILAGRVSGGTFSDGVMKNISTRGLVGTGAQSMIAGFVVGGTVPKNLLVRAVGPTLSSLGVSGAVAATQLAVYSGTSLVASNTGWSTDPNNEAQVAAADSMAGAYPLPVGSADSALVGTFVPGAYTALVSGVGSDTGVGLVEVFDLDQLQLFSSQKLVNVSTRGNVGTGANILIGGIIINGAAPKRLLIRGAGPSLTALGVTGALAAPRLQLFNNVGQIIRENYSWQVGNDAALISAAQAQTGAFAFGNGSSDSAILIVLPPGSYTAELSGAGQSTGTALVEVYEVP
jgi:hypothetical protein